MRELEGWEEKTSVEVLSPFVFLGSDDDGGILKLSDLFVDSIQSGLEFACSQRKGRVASVVRTRRRRRVRWRKSRRTSFQVSDLSIVPLLQVGGISTLGESERVDLRVGHVVVVR